MKSSVGAVRVFFQIEREKLFEGLDFREIRRRLQSTSAAGGAFAL